MTLRNYRARAARVAATLAAVIGLVLVVGVAPASAHPLDHTNPSTTGCASGSYAIYSKAIKNSAGTTIGMMEVRYSPSCGTNWVRVNNYGYGPVAGKVMSVVGGAYDYVGDAYVGVELREPALRARLGLHHRRGLHQKQPEHCDRVHGLHPALLTTPGVQQEGSGGCPALPGCGVVFPGICCPG